MVNGENIPSPGPGELEKLEWMRPVKPKTDKDKAKENFLKEIIESGMDAWRIGFDGIIISPDDDIDIHKGLHHHGKAFILTLNLHLLFKQLTPSP